MKLQHPLQRPNQEDEQGIALVISLLMGMLLITAATGLVVRQLTARKLGASESYQQMAETAASNGFNRIIAVLNNSDENNYRGFLLTEDNQPDTSDPSENWLWEKPWTSTYVKGDFCAERAGLPPIADINGKGITTNQDGSKQSSSGNQWPRSTAGYALSSASLRSDGMGSVQSTFRLRSYTKDFSSGRGTGTFEVEGIIRRTGIDDVPDKTLARARLTRSLQLESSIGRSQDWGVLAARHFNDQGTTVVNGPGRFVWFVGSGNTSLCDSNFKTVSAQQDPSLDIVWPVLLDSDTPYIPSHTIFNRDGTVDQITYKGERYNRVWSFDDTEAGLACGNTKSIVCTRPGALGEETIPDLHTIEQSSGSNQQDTTSSDDEMEYKTIWFGWGNLFFWIGTCTDTENPEKNCASSNTASKSWSWKGPYNKDSKIKGKEISQWRYKPDNPDIKQIGTCKSKKASSCRRDKAKRWTWKDVVSTEKSTEPSNTESRNIIKIDSDDVCTQKSNSDVCHMYIEHMNLSNTDVYIKNNIRPIVLHLNLGEGVNRRVDLSSNYGYKIGNGAKICGVDSLSQATPSCNHNPSQFVITAEHNKETTHCDTSIDHDDLQFEGESLPAAWISMNRGRVRPSNVTSRGMIWASSICNTGDTTIISEDANKTPYASVAKNDWNISDYAGIGRRTVRGIRGSGFDIFKRW